MTPYYQDDHVTIYHGDCRDVLPRLEPVDVVVTSPPYNVLHTLPEKGTGTWGQSSGGKGFLRAHHQRGYDDKMNESEYQKWQNDIFASIPCNDDASLFYNHQIRWVTGVCVHPVRWFTPTGWHMRQEIIWNRGGGMMFNARMFVRFDERLLWFVRGKNWKWNQASVGLGTIWNIAREQQQQGKLHPVAYPKAIPSRCISATADPGDVVLDPFMGSGTTLVAAKELKCNAIGIEIEEKYCEIAVKRLAQEVLPL